MSDNLKNKLHPMTKKGIINFINKNNINKKYEEKINNIKTLEDLKVFCEDIRNKEGKLAEYIDSKIESKLNVKKEVKEVKGRFYLEFDSSVIQFLQNTRKLEDIKADTKEEKEVLDLLTKNKVDKVLEKISNIRKENRGKINIHAYCIDGLVRLVDACIRNLNLINREFGKRGEFTEVLTVTESDKVLTKVSFDFYCMNIEEIELSKEQCDYIFKYLKGNNVKKNVIKASDIKTVKDFTDKIRDIFIDLIEGNKEAVVDFYSILKAFNLFIMLA